MRLNLKNCTIAKNEFSTRDKPSLFAIIIKSTYGQKFIIPIFRGQASIEEMRAVKEWAESSEEHSKQFHRERKLFNAMILIGNPKWTAINTTKRNRYFIREFLKIASVIIIAVSITATIFSITNEHHKHVDIAMQTIIVPAGQRVNIELPDGSNVWLNAGTQMQYPVSFMEDKREIILDGEAYFDVARNENARS